MNRNDLINRLVTRKLSTTGLAKAGCVPCFGGRVKVFCGGGCIPATVKKICWVAAKPAAVNAKN